MGARGQAGLAARTLNRKIGPWPLFGRQWALSQNRISRIYGNCTVCSFPGLDAHVGLQHPCPSQLLLLFLTPRPPLPSRSFPRKHPRKQKTCKGGLVVAPRSFAPASDDPCCFPRFSSFLALKSHFREHKEGFHLFAHFANTSFSLFGPSRKSHRSSFAPSPPSKELDLAGPGDFVPSPFWTSFCFPQFVRCPPLFVCFCGQIAQGRTAFTRMRNPSDRAS